MSKAEDQFNDVHKIIVIGDAGTGKTHLVYCYTKEKVPSNVIVPTVGAQFASKLVTLDNKSTMKAQIWDTTGQEAYRAVTMSFYHKSVGALLVFDVSRRTSYDHIPMWLESLRERTSQDIQIGLIGHKADLGRRQVTREEAEKFAAKQGLFYSETSIRDLPSITSAFKKLLTNVSHVIHSDKVGGGIKLVPQQPESSGCSC